MKSGKNKVRVEDIAKILNISPSSVSRALNDHPRISRKTKEKVRQVALRMGYETGLPELMIPEKAEAITILTPSLNDPVYLDIIRGITDFFLENNFLTFILDSENSKTQKNPFLRTYQKYGTSGIIEIIKKSDFQDESYKSIQKSVFPFVSIFDSDEKTEINCVLTDMYQGILKTLDYFQSLNIERIALILKERDNALGKQTAELFEEILESSGFNQKNCPIIFAGCEESDILQAAKKLLNTTPRPQAILVKGTLMALEIIKLAENQGLKIPEDILLVAIGTQGKEPLISGNISLLKIPAYEMGYKAAEMLMVQIKNPETKRQVSVLPVNLLLKGSAIRLK